MHLFNQHRPRHRWRPPLAAVLMFTLAAFAGGALAVEFDAGVRSPVMKDATELRILAQDFSAKFNSIREATPARLLTDAALGREQFELVWKAKRAVKERRPIDELAPLGITSDVNGIVTIDYNAYPLWLPYEERMASLLPYANMEALGKDLVRRGFREPDVAALAKYLSAHDVNRAAAQRALPVALGFSKLVGSYDKIKRPVDPGLVQSYLYQQAKVRSDATRDWAAGLLQTLDAQRARILVEYVSEPESTGSWSPESQTELTAEILAMVRRPDFEQQAIAEAKGVKP